MIRQIVSIGLLVGVVLPAAVAAQEGQEPAQTSRMRAPVSAEAVLGMRARLELTEDQIVQLSRLREQDVARRQDQMAWALDLRSRLQAGDLSRDEFAAQMSKAREGFRERGQARTEQVTGLLSDAQREKFGTIRREAFRQRARMNAQGSRGQGRAGAARGQRGMRGGIQRGRGNRGGGLRRGGRPQLDRLQRIR